MANEKYKVRYPDALVGQIEGKPFSPPNFTKYFLMAGTDSQIHKQECLYEGSQAYKMLDNHVVIAQVTIEGTAHTGNIYTNIEHTPLVDQLQNLPAGQKMPNDTKIWRYLTFDKFNDLINTQALYFARLDCFTDNLEGTAPISNLKNIAMDTRLNEEQKKESFRLFKTRMESNRKNGFASCWHINDDVNFKMWDEYADDPCQSICVRSNIKRIATSLTKSGVPFISEPVRYFDEPYFNQNVYWFPTLFKRAKYSFENEYRCILYVHGLERPGIKIPVDLPYLINKIYVHPDAPKEFFKKIKILLKEKKLPISMTIAKSHDQFSKG